MYKSVQSVHIITNMLEDALQYLQYNGIVIHLQDDTVKIILVLLHLVSYSLHTHDIMYEANST